MRAMTQGKARVLKLASAVVATVVLASACGGGGTQEIAGVDEGLDGPLPTAPSGAGGASDVFTGDVDVNDLIRRIEALNEESDLCTLLTGQAMADLTTADINLASIASNPAAASQLFSSLERVFAHMIVIAPAEAVPPLTTLQAVWAGMSDIDIRAADAEATASRLLASPETQAANDELGEWVSANCGPV